MDPKVAQARIETLSAEIALKYGVSGTLERQVRRLGRALPRYERAQAAELVRVEKALGHPKLQRQIDPQAFHRAETALQMHLESVDGLDRFKGYALDATTTILVNLLLGGVLLAAILTVVSR